LAFIEALAQGAGGREGEVWAVVTMPKVRAKMTLVPRIVKERDISMDSRGLFDFMGLFVQSKRSHLLTRTYELRLLSLNNLPYSVDNGKQSLTN
jgi:hypothetical protein